MKKTTILVTGATGFLGSHVLEALMSKTVLNNKENKQLNNDIHIIAACRKPSKLLTDFKGEVRIGDLTDHNYVKQVVQDVDVICHTAAWTSLWAHRREEQQLYREPTLTLVKAAIDSGVQRFIFGSSVVVTGPHRNGNAIADHAPACHPGFWPHMDIVADIENDLREHSKQGMSMVALRCGHFAGARYSLGLLSLLTPRLKTHLVPWVAGGRARVPLVDGRDIGNAYVLTVAADGLNEFESFNICGPTFPTMREVIEFVHTETGIPQPLFGVPLWAAYGFAWLMEKLNPLLPGDPFLTQAIVYLGEDWYAPSDYAKNRLGYEANIHWKDAIRRQLKDMEQQGYRQIPLVDPT